MSILNQFTMKTILFTLLLIPFIGFSQITISGTVKDKKTETLIENAMVVLKPSRIKGGGYYSGKKTKKNGLFKLSTNYTYPMQLITTKKGCETKKIKLKKGDTFVEVVIECDEDSIKEIIKEQTSDVDNDGVLDRDDGCINEPGAIENNGCPWPDDDNDGVKNSEDSCINQAGPIENKGCPLPDGDGDGVPDKEDKCPNEAGDKGNNGCPTIPKEFTEFIKSNQNKILFKASSSALDKGGRATLEKVKMLLNTYQNTAIIIEGHTSTDGSASYNQKLSEQRASAIKDYLISQTIDASRISTIGYGENQPIGDNKTVKGRAESRRAKIKISL